MTNLKNTDQKYIISYKDTNWILLRETLNNKILINNKLDTPDKIDKALDNLTSAIQSTKNEFTKRIKIHSNRIELNQEILNLIKQRNIMRKYYQQQFYNQNFKVSRTSKNKIRQCLNEKWSKTLEETKPNERPLWRISKYFRKTKTQIPSLTRDDESFTTDKDKANVISQMHHNTQRNDSISTIEDLVVDAVKENLQRPIDR